MDSELTPRQMAQKFIQMVDRMCLESGITDDEERYRMFEGTLLRFAEDRPAAAMMIEVGLRQAA